MTKQATICVGTLGQGIWRSSDGGDTWLRVRHGLYSERGLQALLADNATCAIIRLIAHPGLCNVCCPRAAVPG